MSVAVLLLLLAVPPDQPIDTLVVCPSEFRHALEPWLEHRQAQGHRIALVSNRNSPEALRATVREVAAAHPLRFLVLVGDADPAMMRDPACRARSVPTHHARAVVNVRWGSEPEIATDNWYADLDDDRMPDLAVGRLTATRRASLTPWSTRSLAYETCADFGHWRRQVHFVAGLGRLRPVADAVLEAAAKTLITSGIPAAYSTTMTYGSWQSPYCPDPRQFDRVTIDRLNEGSLFWVYIGHGQQRSVDVVRVPGGTYPILAQSRCIAARLPARCPDRLLLACYSGAFDQPRDCLAEEMLRNPGRAGGRSVRLAGDDALRHGRAGVGTAGGVLFAADRRRSAS